MNELTTTTRTITTLDPSAVEPSSATIPPAPDPEAPVFRVSHGSLIQALEGFWLAVRERVPELPIVTFTIGNGSDARHPGSVRWGHFGRDRWHAGRRKDRAPHSLAARLTGIAEGLGVNVDPMFHEVFLAGERLADGPEGVAATILHEAAHALAAARGIAEVSRDGRYHNRRFQALAEELGLTVLPQPPIGLAHTEWTPELSARYAPQLLAIRNAITGWRITEAEGSAPIEPPGRDPEADGEDQEEAPGVDAYPTTKGSRVVRTRRSGRVLASCGCRSFRIAASVLALGPIRCDLCGRPFEVRS